MEQDKIRAKILNHIFIDEERCKGCELCIQVCPHHLLSLAEHFNSSGYHPASWLDPNNKCRCLIPLCYLVCPDVAIKAERKERENDRENTDEG